MNGSISRQAFEAEVSRLMDRLYGNALRLTRHRDDAEDLVAETVARAWASRAQLDDPQRLEGWLFRILNNTFISLWRRRRARPEGHGEDAGEEDGSVDETFSLFRHLHQPFLLWWSTPEEEFLNQLLARDIRQALDALPEPFRLVVTFVEVQGHTYEETADLLGIPVGTVRSRLSRARSLLQKALWEQARDAGCDGASRKTRGRRS